MSEKPVVIFGTGSFAKVAAVYLRKDRNVKSLQKLVDRFGERQQLKGVAVYDAQGISIARTASLGSLFELRPAAAAHAAERNAGFG